MLVQYFMFFVAVGVYTMILCTRLAYDGGPKNSRTVKIMYLKYSHKFETLFPLEMVPL